jgi:NADH-quinone oxidoreductase subunit N
VGAFGVILLLEREGRGGRAGSDADAGPGAAAGGRRPGPGDEAVELAAYGGLGARHPVLALALTVFLLSLIGMPPTAGFVGKLYLFGAAIREGFVWLAVIAVVNSVVAAYYYLRLIVFMYMRDPEPSALAAALTPAAGLALAVSVWVTFQLGLWPGPVFALAQHAVSPLIHVP